MKKRVLIFLGVAGMATAGLAMSAGAAPNPNSAAGNCGPPGQTISQGTPNPPSVFGEPPGQAVKAACAPGQQP